MDENIVTISQIILFILTIVMKSEIFVVNLQMFPEDISINTSFAAFPQQFVSLKAYSNY